MCIRDRENAGLLTRVRQGLTKANRLFLQIPDGVGLVPDVGTESFIIHLPTILQHHHLAAGVSPVAYTHLDVYKRQEEGILQQAKGNGTGCIAFSPLAQGLLTNRYLNGIPEDSRMAKGLS